MELVLKDKTTYECTDNSTPLEFIILVADIDEFAEVYGTMTDANLMSFTLDGVKYTNRTLAETKTYKWTGYLEAHFVTLITPEQQRIEELELRLRESEDKAKAYDILMGEEVK